MNSTMNGVARVAISRLTFQSANIVVVELIVLLDSHLEIIAAFFLCIRPVIFGAQNYYQSAGY